MTLPVIPITQYGKAIHVDYPLTPADAEKIEQLEKADISIFTNTKQQLMISAWHFIGSVEFENFILRVDPSFVNITNIGRLYKFANEIESEDEPVKTVMPPGTIKFTDEYNHPLEELVDSFVTQCQKIMKTGIYKSYQTRDESISTLKGKLLLKHQIINLSKFNLKFHCEFDEFTSNNLENVIILDCLNTCQRITKDETMKIDIRNMINQISMEVETKNVNVQDFTKLRYTRLNKNYENAHKVAKSIIMQRGLMHWNERKTSHIHSLFMKTWELFERLVTRLFQDYYPLTAKGQESSTSWTKYNSFEKVVGHREIKPDIIVYKKSGVRDDKVAFVADAKLKEDPNAENFYQVSSYLNKFGIKKGYILMPQSSKMEHLIELDGTWKSEGQDLEIKEILFDVDGILDAKWNGKEDKIKQRLLELIPPQEFV
jgi:5-methylcytosine-specific restriction endonuclease McrBC regulatory subunit McrC